MVSPTELVKEIAALVISLGVILGAGRGVWMYLVKRYEQQGVALSGEWTNEGDITADSPSHYLHLDLHVEGREVSGIVESRALYSETILPNASFVGRRGWRGISGEIVDVSRGQSKKFGTATLRFRRGELEWRLKSGVADFLPEWVSLWKLDRRENRS